MTDLLKVFGLSEGEKDTEYRKIAQSSLELIVDALKKKSLVFWYETQESDPTGWAVVPGSPKNYIVFDLSKIPNHENLQLALGISDGSVSGGLYSNVKGKSRISITAMDKSGNFLKKDGTAINWLNKLSDGHKAAEFLLRYDNVFVHEFIHHLDKKRITTKAWNKAINKMAGGGKATYYNDPIELNAFIQMGFSNFEKRLNHVKSLGGVKLILGATPQEFYKRLEAAMDKNFMANLSADNKKKLQKRSYQFWQDKFNEFK